MKGFKTFFTYLVRNKMFAAINVVGLAVSFMFILLIADMVTRQLTVDSEVADAERIYIFTTGKDVFGHYNLGQRFQDRFPEIENWCAFAKCVDLECDLGNSQTTTTATAFVKENFFDFFGYKVLEGEAKTMLLADNNAVLTRSGAIKLFGTEQAIGKMVNLQFMPEQEPCVFTVTGVVDDIDNSIFPDGIEIFIPIEQIANYDKSMDTNDVTMKNSASAILFFKFPFNYDPAVKQDEILELLKECFWPYMFGVSNSVQMINMHDFYYSDVPTILASEHLNQYDFVKVIAFFAAGIIILLMAVFNYISMSAAQTAYRAKEMATRRLLGSLRGSIFWRMILETGFLTILAFLIGLLLAKAAEPYAIDILGVKLDVLGDFSWLTSACWLMFLAILSLVAGLVPASILSNYNPLDVVKGSFRRKTKMVYLRVLNVLQSGLTITLLACSIYFGIKLYAVLNAPLGYEYGNVLCYPYNGKIEQIQTFRTEVEKLPYVKNVSFTNGTPITGGSGKGLKITTSDTSAMVVYRIYEVDSAFFKVFNIKILENRNLADKTNSYYLSENALEHYKRFNLGTDRLMFDGGVNMDIAGVFNNFQIGSLLIENMFTNILIRIKNKDEIVPQMILVDIDDGDEASYKHQIDKLYENIVKPTSFESVWYGDIMRGYYMELINFNKILIIFTIAALIISLLGLIAMNIYMISQRKRDMSVRKVFGSTAMDEQIRLMRFSMWSIIIGLVVALPLIWIGFSMINSFIPYGDIAQWWIPIAAFAMVAVVSLVSVFLLGRKAANENPINNLKTE